MVEANGKLDHETMRKVTFQIPPWYYVRLALITLESDQFPMFLYYQHLCHDLGWLLCWGNQPLTQETNLPTSETFVTTMHIVMITLLVHRTDRVINWRLLVTFEKKCIVIKLLRELLFWSCNWNTCLNRNCMQCLAVIPNKTPGSS